MNIPNKKQPQTLTGSKSESKIDFNSVNNLKNKFKDTICKKKIQDYSFLLDQIIGIGLTSVVYKGQNDLTKQSVAIKVIDLKKNSRKNSKILLQSQIQILRQLKHENIIELKQIYNSANNCYIITQFCQDGNLNNYIKQQTKIPQLAAIKILKDICAGYSQIIKKNIIHRDIKPANIFLTQNKVKIADFGFSMKIGNTQLGKINAGSPAYMAPQSLFDCDYSFKSDIFSIGIVFYEMLHGYTPWRCFTEKQLVKKLKTQSLKFDQKIALSQLTKDFIIKCLKIKKQQRINEIELLAHPILSNSILQINESKETNATQSPSQQNLELIELRVESLKKNVRINQLVSPERVKTTNLKMKDKLTKQNCDKISPIISFGSMKALFTINQNKQIAQDQIKNEKVTQTLKIKISPTKPLLQRKHLRTHSQAQGVFILKKQSNRLNTIKFFQQLLFSLKRNKKNLYFKQLFDKVSYIIQKILSIILNRAISDPLFQRNITEDPYLKTIQKSISLKQIAKVAQFYLKRLIQMISYTLKAYSNRSPCKQDSKQFQTLLSNLSKTEAFLTKIKQAAQSGIEDVNKTNIKYIQQYILN